MSDSYTEIKYTAPPQSRNEAILAATVDGTQYTDPPQSRIEDLLVQVKEKIEQGGSGGTSDYTDLANKPQINGTTIVGDKSSADLGLLPASTRYGASISANKYMEPVTGKLKTDTILKDQNGNAMATITSDQPVVDVGCDSSGLLVTYPSARASVSLSPALAGKVDKEQGKGLSTEDYTTTEKTALAGQVTKTAGIDSTANNYIEMGNGLRLYISSTEPTGNDIPDGSVWVGGMST